MKWISVKDKMPPDGEFVLVASDYYGNKRIDYYVTWFSDENVWKMWDAVDESGWAVYIHKYCKVTHWLPRPDFPKGD